MTNCHLKNGQSFKKSSERESINKEGMNPPKNLNGIMILL